MPYRTPALRRPELPPPRPRDPVDGDRALGGLLVLVALPRLVGALLGSGWGAGGTVAVAMFVLGLACLFGER
jgi:hypothetical protein